MEPGLSGTSRTLREGYVHLPAGTTVSQERESGRGAVPFCLPFSSVNVNTPDGGFLSFLIEILMIGCGSVRGRVIIGIRPGLRSIRMTAESLIFTAEEDRSFLFITPGKGTKQRSCAILLTIRFHQCPSS